jgi:hypothetical protein
MARRKDLACGDIVLVHYYDSDVLKRIKSILEAGCPVLSRKELCKINVLSGRFKEIMIKSSFDALCAMGLPFREDDFVLADPAEDPFLDEFDWGEEAEEVEGVEEEEDGDY